MPEDAPGSPLTPMMEAMAQLREMYESFIEGGFTEQQATRMVAIFLAEMTRGGDNK